MDIRRRCSPSSGGRSVPGRVPGGVPGRDDHLEAVQCPMTQEPEQHHERKQVSLLFNMQILMSYECFIFTKSHATLHALKVRCVFFDFFVVN